MNNNDLDFDFDMEDFDRRKLLEQAAEELNALQGALSGMKPAAVPDTPEAAMVRALMNDDAKFGEYPLVYEIKDEDFIKQNREVPFHFIELTKDYNFYWVRLPVQIMPQDNWAYDRLKLHIKLIAEDAPQYAQPRSYQILPTKKFQTLLELNSQLEVSLDSNFEFSAGIAPQRVDIGAARASVGGAVGAQIDGHAGLVVGPFMYQVKKAQIDHNAVGTEEVKWSIDGKEFFQDYNLQLVVIVQVPQTTRQFKLLAQMQAYRHFKFAPARLQKKMKQLSEAVKDFFGKGVPVEAKAEWILPPPLNIQ
jgi:hypothetical protein